MKLNYKYIKSKFIIPKKKRKIIYRDKILRKLDKISESKFTIISSPAGSGKTISMVSWIYSRNLSDNVIWISLDERDNNLELFWSCFFAAIERFKNEDLNSETISLTDNEETFTQSMINMLLNVVSLIDKELILVIDNFHFIKDQNILTGLKYFIDGMPENVHLIVLSRIKPNINIARLRLEGEVIEIDSEDLLFSLEETSEFLKENVKLEISEDNVKQLNKHTEGWIAGIQIAALPIQEQKDIIETDYNFGKCNKYIEDYFDEEVFNNQNEETKDFLLKTSVLDELTIELCNAVTGKNNSLEILDEIYNKNLFVESINDDKKEFKYYNIFKEFLINKIDTINKELLYEVSNRAARWYEKNEYISKAIDQYIQAENFEQVVNLIENECIEKVFTDEYFNVIHWIENIPKDTILKSSRLCMTYLHIYIYEDSIYEKYLDVSERLIDKETDTNYKNESLGILFIIKGDRNFIQSEYKKSIEYYEVALEYLKNNKFWQTIITLKLGITYYQLGDLDLEKKNFDEAILLSQSYESDVLYLIVNKAIIFTKLLSGELNKCEDICNECLNINISDNLKESSLMSIFYVILALVYYEKNLLEKAESYAVKGIRLIEKKEASYSDFYTVCMGYYVYSGILLQTNNKNELSKVNEKVENLFLKYNNRLVDRYYFNKLKDNFDVLKIQRIMEAGKTNFVEKHIVKMDFRIIEEMVIFSRMLFYKGKIDDALMLLNKTLTCEKKHNNKYLSIKAHIFRAEIFSQKDQYENAAKDLREALKIGCENGFIKTFLFKHIKMSKILLKTIKGMKYNKDYYKMKDYLNKILSLYSTEENSEIISKREKEVLLLIENGAKNCEIAKALIISESTAKSHILNIFTKLGVHNRVQAIAKAKEIGII